MNQSQMQAEQPEDSAQKRFHQHLDTIVGLWGPDFLQDPRYQLALDDVRRGRHPANVLADYR